jgi:3-hydroxybutyryl-CoA dehydrogenase
MNSGFERVGVIGAGLMGAEIALVHALAGCEVVLVDRSPDILQTSRARIARILESGVSKGRYTPEQKVAASNAIREGTDLIAVRDCGLVVEAVWEAESVKTEVMDGLGGACRADCVIATNTSTIPISVLASYLPSKRREFFVGTHYFSPVSRMKLVEIIPSIFTSEETVEAVVKHCRHIGKEPIQVKDVAGFAVNRMLHALMIEAVRLVEEGVASPADLDRACRLGLGHPMGPFELMDEVTSSLCLQAQEILWDAYGDRFRPRPLLKQRVKAGLSGGKGKPGWYTLGAGSCPK